MNVVQESRSLMSVEKLDKVINHLQEMVHRLDKSFDLQLHKTVDQFYYMQKVEELKFLKDEYEVAIANLKRIQNRLENDYPLIFETWRRDVRSFAKLVSRAEYDR